MLTLALVLVLHVQACPQRIVVTVPSTRSTTASLSLLECGRRVAGPWSAHVGYRGVSRTGTRGRRDDPARDVRDRPDGLRASTRTRGRLRYHRLVCGDWWDEDPRSPSYNRFRHVACGSSPPFGGGSEALWREPVAYREFAVIEYNSHPRARPRLGDLPARQHRAGRRTAASASNGAGCSPCSRRLRPGAQITITA